MKPILAIILLTTISLASNGQTPVTIDGDKIHLRDSLDGKVRLLRYVERGEQNRAALWITYDRKPGVDPWIQEATNKSTRYSEETFIKYWHERGIKILGAITTYDDCQCAKLKRMDSPDMFLIHFKIFPADWKKLKEIYPEVENDVRKIR